MDAVVDLEAVLGMCREAKLPKPYWVRWAIECAERVISIWVAEYPNDLRPVQAIEAAKSWISTPTTDAARDAASAASAARAAADSANAAYYAAAYSAAYYAAAASAANAAYYAAAYAAYSAYSAAYYAAANAAYSAAYYAAANANAANANAAAASAAEILWQVSRLLEIYHEANTVSPEGE